MPEHHSVGVGAVRMRSGVEVLAGAMAVFVSALVGCAVEKRFPSAATDPAAVMRLMQAVEGASVKDERVDCPLRCSRANGIVGCFADCPPAAP